MRNVVPSPVLWSAGASPLLRQPMDATRLLALRSLAIGRADRDEDGDGRQTLWFQPLRDGVDGAVGGGMLAGYAVDASGRPAVFAFSTNMQYTLARTDGVLRLQWKVQIVIADGDTLDALPDDVHALVLQRNARRQPPPPSQLGSSSAPIWAGSGVQPTEKATIASLLTQPLVISIVAVLAVAGVVLLLLPSAPSTPSTSSTSSKRMARFSFTNP